MRFRRRAFGTACRKGSTRAGAGLQWMLPGSPNISNSGLALLLQVGKQIQERSGRMVLCALHKPVKRVLEITGFMSLFSISARRKRPFRLPVRLTLFEPPMKRLTSLQRKQFSEIFRVSLILAASYDSAKQA